MAFGAHFQIRASRSGWQAEGVSFATWDLASGAVEIFAGGTLESVKFLPKVLTHLPANLPNSN